MNCTSILCQKVLEVNNINEIKKIFNWKKDPIYKKRNIEIFRDITDINERKKRDAEVLGAVICNTNPEIIVEIGTGTGETTAYIAQNCPNAKIYTINAPMQSILNGESGVLTTEALTETEIGKEYKKLRLDNIIQLYVNTRDWEPQIKDIDIAFIDGCHDASYVINDTMKILKVIKKNGFILWHDFNPKLRYFFPWINEVCKGIEWLYSKNILTNYILLLKDSWIGLYQVK